ncbi:MAG: aldo/keto reductase [Planctomycetes bacterium]|nr:aldo/keto reductase [Planctomycetota bacterium]
MDHEHAGTPSEHSTLTRRAFVRGTSALVAGAALGLGRGLEAQPRPPLTVEEVKALGPIPKAVLGRTGLEITIVGLGTALLGHQNSNKPEIPKLVGVFGEALDLGINYVDTARMYGGAEEALKTVLKGRRDKVILATKVWPREFTAKEAEDTFHESLRTLGVDSVDVLHLHSAGDKDMDKVLAKGGTWEFLEKAKAAGKARFLGMSGHSRPANFLRLLETDKVDVLMVAMNFVDRHIYGFEEKVLPVARKHKTGVLAMKVYGGITGGFQNYGAKTPHPSQLDASHHVRSIAYAKSLEGVAALVLGVHSSEQLRENVKRVLETRPLSKEDFDKLCEEGKTIAAGWTPRFGPVA